MGLRFGVITIQNVPWEQELVRWKKVEELGFDSVWVADHFVDFTRPHHSWFEAWTLLAALASHTSRIRVGTLVTNVFWRNPVFLARQAMTLDHVSGGRLELGLGAGVSAEVDPTYRMTGLRDWGAGGRVDRFEEILEMLDSLLRREATDYHGRFYDVEGAVICPQTIQRPRPPFTVAALGRRMLNLAARYGDAWNTFGGLDLSPEKMYEKVKADNALLDDCCQKIGRDPASLRRSLLLYGEEAWTLFDSEDNLRLLVEKYAEAGITEFILYYPRNGEQVDVFENVSRDVIPELRAIYA